VVGVTSDPIEVGAFRHAPVGVIVARPDGVVVAGNPAAGRLLGREAADLLDSVLFDVVHPDDVEEAHQQCARLLAGRTRVLRHECRFRLRDGRVIWVSVSVSRMPEGVDRVEHMVVHIDDISERKQREADLSHQALHDPLTGLANRALLLERIREAMSGRGRHARPSHLFYLDLNGFKEVNDRFGHAAGDVVLTQLAHRIVALLRAGDTAARLGGDEFAVLCDDTEPRHAASIADRLRVVAAEPFLIEGTRVCLSAAVGSSPARVADPAELLREADRRMYETKRRTASAPVPEPRGAAPTGKHS
jgi:diguanylate cyclase (GGDEF)-like protein/PAS domain S-box-containing protein